MKSNFPQGNERVVKILLENRCFRNQTYFTDTQGEIVGAIVASAGAISKSKINLNCHKQVQHQV